jgi:hypothetical protein
MESASGLLDLSPGTPSGAAARPRSNVSEESRSNVREGARRTGARLFFRSAPAASGPSRCFGLSARRGRFIYPPLWVDWAA